MSNPLDLTKYIEDDEDEEEAFMESELKKNKKRSDWAKGKSRAQPSENWDNDFLFGSVSTESLPLPSKTASRPNPPTRKPGSAHSTSASTHLHSSSLQHSLNQPLPPLSKHSTSISRPPIRTANSDKTEDHAPPLNLPLQGSNCSTPRKRDPHSPRSHLSVPPSLSSFASSNSSFDPTISTSLRSSIKNSLKSPPASLPPSSRALTHTALDFQTSALDSSSKASLKTMGHKGTVSDRTSRPSRPPLSLRTRQASHKAVSSQDSVPSASDLSSLDIRSPSSSLSTTDDGHGNWSRSSGDYSAGFGGSGKGNRSFHTETEFTEPDTELDWGDDTDHENRSSCSPVNLHQSTNRARALYRSQPASQTAKLHGNNSSRTCRSGSTAHSHHPNEPSRAISDSSSYRSDLISQANPSQLESSSLSPSQKLNEHNQVRRSAHSSFDSQTTFTTTHSSKSRNLDNPASLNSAASSSSSIGYYKSNHSDISLKSSLSRVSRNSIEILTNNLSQNHEAHLRRQQARTPALSSASSNFPLPYGNHSSDSYEAATSGTETDGLSDHAQARRRKSPMASTSSSNRVTPNATQRSRKQALYSRPPNANPSSSVSSLAGSISSTTLNMNSLVSPDRFTDDGDADADISFAPSTEDESRLKNLRKRLRRKRPSALALSPTPVTSPSTVLDRKSSVSESIYVDSQSSGDLAFAADSDEEGRGQLRRPSRTVAIGSTSPYQVIDSAEVLSINLRSPTPVANRGLNLRARSSVSHSGPSPSPLLNGHSSKPTAPHESGNIAKKFKSRRPLSFTALLSRNSIASISSAQSSNHIVGDRHIDPIPNSASPARGLFARKSSETVRDQVSKKEMARTQSQSSGIDSESIRSERPTRGHFRQAASIGSNPVNFKASKPSNSSLEPSESFISRVRRLSSRQSSHQKTPPATPNRKRFSIMSGGTRTTPSNHLYSPPSTSSQALSAASTPSSKRNHRSPTISGSGIPASTSKGSELTVRAESEVGRKARPCSKDSSSSRPSGLLRGSSLRRKFSTSTNNKASVDEPNLTVSPPAAPQSITDHNLSGSASSITSSTGPRLRSMGSSKPPKSNPALRKRVAATVSATLENYKLANTPPTSQTMDDFQLVSPKSAEFDISPDPSIRQQTSRIVNSTYAPYSEPLPDQSVLPISSISPIMPGSMGGITTALGRSNSMGELRIPSRITSQQGRLHTELNQMKEFARGIDDLKLMRRNYRRLIESTTRAQLSSAASDSSMTTRDEKENPSAESPSKLSEDMESVQPSPRALARISSNIARIELNYREWWTCCNVLIDLGEGEKDPKERFPHDRDATSSSDQSGSTKEGAKDEEEHEHFEILKNMFGPGGPIENENVKTPPKQQNVLRGERSFERTPVGKSQRVLKNVSSSGPILMMSPETPTAKTLPDGQEYVIEDDEDDGSVKGKENIQNRNLWVNSPSEESSEGHGESLRIEKSLRGKSILRRSGGSSSIRVCSEGCASISSSVGSRNSKALTKSAPAPIVDQQQQSRKISLIMRNGSGKINGAGSARNALQGVKDFLRTLKAKIQEDKLVRKHTISSSSSVSASSSSSIFIEIVPSTEILNPKEEHSPTPSTPRSMKSSSSSSEEECWDDQILEPTTTTSNLGIGTGQGKKRLALSSERMPQLLNYLAIVRDQCEACLDELKSQTV
ncbi:hypothetical protein DFH28DRAFT_488810 [Melampsora americana]|nr:hypothetical protein DFH28DRAFT_488810 [Melampsora americana]